MSRERLRALENAPFAEVLQLLCRQASEWLSQREPAFSPGETFALVSEADSARRQALTQSLTDLVSENRRLLWRRWRLDFADSLAADVSALEEWQSTADLLRLANDKAEAEQRILVGAALLLACGDDAYISLLRDVIRHDEGADDIDAVIAKRVLQERGIAST